MIRFFFRLIAALALGIPALAQAQVQLSFHSFNGTLFGRYPHTFIVLEGTLEKTGEAIRENYGFTAKSIGPNVLLGPAEHMVYVEKQKYIDSTNRHFTVSISDRQYAEIKAEMARWRDAPGKYYILDERNCIHFVAAIARIVGLKADVPSEMVRKPKAWLNYITGLNPSLRAKPID